MINMRFVFDESKLREHGLTEEEAMLPIQRWFRKHDIQEKSKGIFESDKDEDYGHFAVSLGLPDVLPYFMDCIKIWEWYVDDGDGKENLLAEYQKHNGLHNE